MLRRGGIRILLAFALVAMLMGPARASATGFDPAQRGQVQWLDVGDLWARFQKWLGTLAGNQEKETGKRGSSIDPDGAQGTGES